MLNILKTIPDARFIVMVRNPIDMAVSLHAEFRANADDDIRDFATAWSRQEARRNGRQLHPRLCRIRAVCSMAGFAASDGR